MAAPLDQVLAVSLPELDGVTRKEIVAAVRSYRARLRGEATAGPATTSEPGKLLRLREAAQRLGMCRRSIYNLARAGQIRLVKVGRRGTRVPEAEVLRIAAGQGGGQATGSEA